MRKCHSLIINILILSFQKYLSTHIKFSCDKSKKVTRFLILNSKVIVTNTVSTQVMNESEHVSLLNNATMLRLLNLCLVS